MLMEYLYWIFISVYVIVVVATIINVLMDNRLPVKTMAWVMVLAFMPVVGIVLYFFFGQDTRKEKLISQHASTCSPNDRCWNLPCRLTSRCRMVARRW